MIITRNACPVFAQYALEVVDGVLDRHPEPTNPGTQRAPGVLKADCEYSLESLRLAARHHRALMAAGALDEAYQYAYTAVRFHALDFIRTYTGDTSEGSAYHALRNTPTIMPERERARLLGRI